MRSGLTLAILVGVVVAAGGVAASAVETDPGGAQTLRLRGTQAAGAPTPSSPSSAKSRRNSRGRNRRGAARQARRRGFYVDPHRTP